MIGRILAWWRRWRRQAAVRRAAERSLDELFRDPRLLDGTSLRPDHRPRCQLLDLSGAPDRIGFGIVRHPRPYPFSRQRHEVVELWLWSPHERRVERVRGINVSRARGRDDADGSFAPPP
ncbi:MAG: hypothetical protein FJ293_08695 [Planctomycetes bacterium]|nr:hypothetical protein [Planctomycetota bacterium]